MKKFNFIWLGYADLMTTLFFVMLVMFCLSFALYLKATDKLETTVEKDLKELELRSNESNQKLFDARDSLRVAQEKYDKINEITDALDRMSDDNYFRFNENCKRHELVHGSVFDKNSPDIKYDQRPRLIALGRQLSSIVNQIDKEDDIQYMLVIEGRAGKFEDENINNQFSQFARRLSFERAKALVNLWESNNISFDEKVCQLIISGSGYGGACRYTGDEEEKNKTFIIQLIPKVGQI